MGIKNTFNLTNENNGVGIDTTSCKINNFNKI